MCGWSAVPARICAPIRRTGLIPATGRSTIGSLTNSGWASLGSRLTPCPAATSPTTPMNSSA